MDRGKDSIFYIIQRPCPMCSGKLKRSGEFRWRCSECRLSNTFRGAWWLVASRPDGLKGRFSDDGMVDLLNNFLFDNEGKVIWVIEDIQAIKAKWKASEKEGA